MKTIPWPWNQLVEEIQKPWGWLLILVIVAGIGIMGMPIAQFIKCLRTKNTTSLNKYYTIIYPIGTTVLVIYDIILFVIVWFKPVEGTIIFNWQAFFPMLMSGLTPSYGIMILKLKHVHAAKKLGLTEMQYYLKYLKPTARSTRKKK